MSRLAILWQRLTWLDRMALAPVLFYALVWLARAFRQEPPLSPLISLLFFLSLGYFLFRLLRWTRGRLLWSLRNRLLVAYLFIAVVPVLLLIVMVALSAYILYWQLGAYVVYDDVQKRLEQMAGVADAIASTIGAENAPPSAGQLSSPAVAAILTAARAGLPGLEVHLGAGQDLLKEQGGRTADRFVGLVQTREKIWLRAVVTPPTLRGPVTVSTSVAVTPELLESIAPEMGPMQLAAYRPATERDTQGVITIGGRRIVAVGGGRVSTRRRTLPPRANWLDYAVDGVAKMDAVSRDAAAGNQATNPVLVSFTVRPSQLNRRLFGSLGEIGGALVTTLLATGVVFLVLEVAALKAGITLTRTITQAVADLYQATRAVQAGDFTHRVRVRQKDQLGELGESFNLMTSSISALIEEQRQRQRLENELTIAREVQAQLFPRELPTLPGITLAGVCRAARMVSGDYYDFIRLSPTRLGMALADISGKGISAALLMASLQAALRSQVLLDGGSSQDPAEVVTRLNRHLYLNTSEDRYATLFYAVLDADSRTLRYTNAGHFPPMYLVGEEVHKLEQGGMVIGLFDDCTYEQGTIQLAPGGLLIAYSDGLIEPENVYGEEFGVRRLLEVALRDREAPPQRLAETLLSAAEEWAGTPEQSDDMTVIVARV